MGVVFLAEQEEPVRRKVAVKIIKLGMDTRQVMARFEAERQALALMDHPNIARVLDAGATDAGRPYFVMELVRGISITDFCRDHSLSDVECVRLFLPVCRAIESAHQKWIIHRDLKPSNVLVTLDAGIPHPMVIDFGVAKATNQRLTEKTLFTQFATVIGTPAYMSPEQAGFSRFDVDTRSDIYSLGVLLYELLTGTTPFPEERLCRAGWDEMQRILLHEEPDRPSTRITQLNASPAAGAPSASRRPRSSLEPDLDWIIMKCLEKEQARRYDTAEALAADLGRHVQNEPVLARPPSAGYRLVKLYRRRKPQVLAMIMAVVALLAAAGISAWQAVRATRAEQRLRQEVRRATESLATARAIHEFNRLVGTTAATRGWTAAGELVSDHLDQWTDLPELWLHKAWVSRCAGDDETYRKIVHRVLSLPATAISADNQHVPVEIAAMGPVDLSAAQLEQLDALMKRLGEELPSQPEEQQAWGYRATGQMLLRLGRLRESLDALERSLARQANLDAWTFFLKAMCLHRLDCVAASTRSDTLWEFSSRGRSAVHLAAPGVDIAAALMPLFTGCSAAAPHVTGAIALLKSAVPGATAVELKGAILGSVDQRASLRSRVITGGRLNVAKALARLTNPASSAGVVEAHPVGSRTRPDDPIWMRFSRPMNPASVEASFQMSPEMAGHFEWTDDNRTMRFVASGPLERTNSSVVLLGSAEDAAGGTLDGNFNGTAQGSPEDDVRWTFGFPTPNDHFADALPIMGGRGSVGGTTTNALPELDEPDHAASPRSAATVWYRWTPVESGWITFDTFQRTRLDTLLAVYSGDHLTELVPLVSNDDYLGSRSRVSFAAVANESYRIAVAGKSDVENAAFIISQSQGAFELAWYPTPPPGLTGSGFSPGSGMPESRVTLTGTNFTGATEVLFQGASASFTPAPTNNLDLRLTAVVPPDASSGPITIKTPHGDVTSSASFQVLPPTLTIRTHSAGEVELSWPAISSTIGLETTDALLNPVWSAVPGPRVREEGGTAVEVLATGEGRYYRLRAP